MNFLRLLESGDLGLRFLITLLFVSLLIALGSFKKENPKRNTYTYFVISMVVFFLCFTLNTIDLNLGMALHGSDGAIYPIWGRWWDGPGKRARVDLAAWEMLVGSF